MKLYNQYGTCFNCQSLGSAKPKLSGKGGISYQSSFRVDGKELHTWEKNGSEHLVFFKDGLWYRIPGLVLAKNFPGRYHQSTHATLFTKDPTIR